MRTSNRSELKLSLPQSTQQDDKKSSQVNNIDEQKEKIDDYLQKMNRKINKIIQNKISKVVTMTQNIVQIKDKQIQSQREVYQKYKQTQLYQEYTKSIKRITQYQQNMKRLSDILQMYKRQADKYKIQLDIKQKQLRVNQARQKKLIKKIWILEQNIKDIYNYQTVHPTQPPIINSHLRNKCKVKNHHRNRTVQGQFIKSFQITSKTIYTDQHQRQQNQQLKIKIQDRPSTSRQNIYSVTKLNQHLNRPNSSRYQLNQSQQSFSSMRQTHNKTSFSQNKKKKISIYEDVRHSIRKVSNLDGEGHPYLQQSQRQIGLQQFKLIVLHLPKFLKKISELKVTDTNFLKQIDQQSIHQLEHLFSNVNSVKILQIILFNFTIQALRQIKSKKETLKLQNTYSQPIVVDSIEEIPSARVPKYQKHRVDLAIHKNFKSKNPNKKQYHASLKKLIQE